MRGHRQQRFTRCDGSGGDIVEPAGGGASRGLQDGDVGQLQCRPRAFEKFGAEASRLDQCDWLARKDAEHESRKAGAAADIGPTSRPWRKAQQLGAIDDVSSPYVVLARGPNLILSGIFREKSVDVALEQTYCFT